MAQSLTYSNGLRVVVDHLPSMRTVCSGIWVGVGSAYETSAINGISHFVEHTLFKGTDKLSAFQIADGFERLGAQVNAFTGKECTCYYFKSIDEYAEQCFGMLAHIFFDSCFDPAELDRERCVVLEELNMVQDSPEDLCYDLIADTVYQNSPLGQTILGPAENIRKFDRQQIGEFLARFYCPANIVIAFAGCITVEEVDRIVRAHFLPRLSSADFVRQEVPTGSSLPLATRFADFEQANIILSYPAIPFDHPKIHVQALLNAILGGGMSSRLFQRIREQLGLAYSVYSHPTTYVGDGRFNIVCNISPTNTRATLTEVRNEVTRFVDQGVEVSEFERAKAQLKSAFIFGRENVQTCMTSLGKRMISIGKLFDYQELVDQINAVTTAQVNEYARSMLDFGRVSCAYVGRQVPMSDFDSLN